MNKIVTTLRADHAIELPPSAGEKIAVLNPVGFPPKVNRKAIAPRPESLEGKTIYLVDCRFDDSIELLKQVQNWFAEFMPAVKTKIVSLSATYQHDDPKTWEEIKANGHAAIVGVGHCSNCSPAVATHAITLETRYGVPTVAIHTDKFDRVVTSVTKMAGLPDARLLQAMTLTLLEAGEMAVRPPMIATKNAIRSDVNLFSGGITWVDAEYDERLGEVLRPLTQDKGGLPFGKEIHGDTREMLAQAFYLNKLNLPSPTRDMTAYETSQRIQEYIRSALPLFEPMEIEYNGSLCEDTFWDMFNNNMFGPVQNLPQSIQGENIRFTFESPLHQAIEKQKGQIFLQGGQMIAQAVQLDPSAQFVVDAVTALRDALEGLGMPAPWIRDAQEAQAIIDQHRQDAQDQQQMSQVGQGADVAQKVALAQQALTGSAAGAAQ